ncbi:MAG: type II toxin-antitoxin system PemK/MazF family toxin, partial [Chloroflexi bacterium]|nr:type II toxin-antitoxin system PemK/MazF family toxin [Chloroflexota bacterium]
MTGYSRGEVVLVSFVFPDETGVKRRPAVIVSSNAYQLGRQGVIIAAITSRTDRVLVGDHLITQWRQAGLLFPSVATGIIRTIKQGMIAGKLGAMPLTVLPAATHRQAGDTEEDRYPTCP